MVIRIFVLCLLFIQVLCFAQNVDSIDAVYQKYYRTDLLMNSPSGQYAVLNHNNTYGKDNDELVDTKTGKVTALDKHLNYQFLDDDRLLMINLDHCRFQNLENGNIRDVSGNYVPTFTDGSGQVVLYSYISKELILTSKDGIVLWKAQNVVIHKLDKDRDRLIFVSDGQLWVRDLKNNRSKNFKLDSDIQWMSFHGDLIYCANINALQLELYTLNILSDKLTKQTISSPEYFEFADKMTTYFEIREDEHFVFPLYFKSKLNDEKNTELKITYSSRNSRDKMLNHHLGIYNLKERQWDYRPNTKDHLPIYKFLNEKGDFIIYDRSGDTVEEQQNVILDFRLMLDYGKSFHILPQKRIEDGNYLWDHGTRQFIYFEDKRWMCYHIGTGKNHELLPLNLVGWESQEHNGLVQAPEINPVYIKDRSAIMLSNQYDYFIVDLKTHQTKRMTNGEEQKIKYKLETFREQFPSSSWNIKFAQVNLEKEITFKLFNETNYDSGFATYLHKRNKVIFYRQGHYKKLIPYKNGHFLTSDFALEPFKLTKVEDGKYSIVYESLIFKKKDLERISYKIFQYKTIYGIANAAMLFPLGYDKQKKYPMVVNIYEKISRDMLNFTPPYLRTVAGFNYLHYLMNGYIVLLPDLQYETANVKNSIVISLEKSIDYAKLLASFDDQNIGILGMSFGGYETGLALSNSKYFKTGVAGVMVSDLVSHALSNSEMMTKPNYMRTENQQHMMSTNVFDGWNSYLEDSPIYHMKNIKAPVLIWNGSKDKNVSPTQSKMFFLGMKRLQKKAVLLEYLNETHNILLPPNQLDLDIKTWQWFDYYLKNRLPADWIVPLIK